MKVQRYTYILLIFLLLLNSCYKREFESGSSSSISFSVDTVQFDTIFTKIGSAVKTIKVYNNSNQYVRLNRVLLQKGGNSEFSYNIDGRGGPIVENLEIPGNDSLFLFVNVEINPKDDNDLLVFDSLAFNMDGGTAFLPLAAYGQNVHLKDAALIGDETWVNDKPYLIVNNVAVNFDKTLKIDPGVRIYLNKNSSFVVYGSLKAEGSIEEPILFTGERFDRGYAVSAGQWRAIYFDPESSNNLLQNVHIKNAVSGIQINQPANDESQPDLTLVNTYIENSSFCGIYAFNAKVDAYNLVIGDAGTSALILLQGGDYNFYHTTIHNINSYASLYGDEGSYGGVHSEASLILLNYFQYFAFDRYFNIKDSTYNSKVVNANFYNSIITGSRDQELMLRDNKETEFNYLFQNCILKQPVDSNDFENEKYFKNIILNEEANFINADRTEGERNYRLDTLSPAKDAANLQIVNDNIGLLELDFDGNSRTADGKPDIGAFERIE